MKQPTLSQFKAALEDLINDAPAGKLKENIYTVAEETRTESRLDFLEMAEQLISGNCEAPREKTGPVVTPEALFVKGGIEELRRFAYEKGNEIPAIFLAFFNEQKERDAPVNIE